MVYKHFESASGGAAGASSVTLKKRNPLLTRGDHLSQKNSKAPIKGLSGIRYNSMSDPRKDKDFLNVDADAPTKTEDGEWAGWLLWAGAKQRNAAVKSNKLSADEVASIMAQRATLLTKLRNSKRKVPPSTKKPSLQPALKRPRF